MTSKANVSWLKRLTSRAEVLEKRALFTSPVSVTAARTVTEDEAYAGIVINNTGATGEVDVTLPAAKVGMQVTGVVTATQLLTFVPATGEVIHLGSGAAQAANTDLKANAIGESVTLTCHVAGKWFPTRVVGTWTATGA